MDREIKFRAWDKSIKRMSKSFSLIEALKSMPFTHLFALPFSDNVFLQFTGLKDKNGAEIFEGDIIKINRPYRSYQDHNIDSMPTIENLEPEIKTIIKSVKFTNGSFVLNEEQEDEFILALINKLDFITTKDQLIEVFGAYQEEWGDDLEYLLDQYNLKSEQELINHISGCEVIGNIFEHSNLLEANNEYC